MVCQFGSITNSGSLGSAKDGFSSVKTLRNLRYVKYAGLTAWLLALIFIILINVSRSYASNQSDQAGAEAGLSTLATTVTGPAEVGMSDPGDVSLSAITEGGIVTGGHNLTVSSTSVAGYEVAMESDGALKDDSFAGSESTNNTLIMSTTGGTLTAPAPLTNNSWGVAIVGNSGFDDVAVYQSTDQSVLSKAKFAPIPGRSGDNPNGQVILSGNAATTGDTRTIYYGVKTDPYFRAGNYSTTVVYTITAELPDTPTITSVTPDSYQLESGASGQITIEGTNLSSAYSVYLTNASGDTVGDCTNLNVVDDTQLTCTIPTTGISAGDYTIYVVTQGGEDTTGFTYEEKQPSSVTVDYAGDVGKVTVDYDENMIPVIYTGSTSSAQWTALPRSEVTSNPATWFNYTNRQWANAVTVSNPEEYKNITERIVVNDSDIEGFWVYIPRYAYRVLRRDASNSVVQATNFDIRFETSEMAKKEPVACSGNYQSCANRAYGAATGTAWATHPAFTWSYEQSLYGDNAATYELNGIWVGKFETTGSSGSPTILPDKTHLYSYSGIGSMYDIAQKIGVEDKLNVYGASTTTSYNGGKGYHSLASSTTHMLKNSEWGAVAYLSASRYGAGVNAVQENNSSGSNATGHGPNGGSYNTSDGRLASTTGNPYGVYDMVGGAFDYVAASWSTASSPNQSSANGFSHPAQPPYVDLYPATQFTATGNANFNRCIWEFCGGHALHETLQVASVPTSSNNSMWGDDEAFFVEDEDFAWFMRGASTTIDQPEAGIFNARRYLGTGQASLYIFRVALIPAFDK